MTTRTNLMGTGMPAAQTRAVVGYIAPAPGNATLTATGTNQATAYAIQNDLTLFGTVASGTGAILPAPLLTNSGPELSEGDMYSIWNGGANALLVYPPTGMQIGTAAVNAGVSIAANKFVTFTFAGYVGVSPVGLWLDDL